jgi:hypothetical protein
VADNDKTEQVVTREPNVTHRSTGSGPRSGDQKGKLGGEAKETGSVTADKADKVLRMVLYLRRTKINRSYRTEQTRPHHAMGTSSKLRKEQLETEDRSGKVY